MPNIVTSEIIDLVRTAAKVAGKGRTEYMRVTWLVWSGHDLTIRATDSQVDYAARVRMPAPVDAELIIGVDGKMLHGLLAKLQGGEVELHVLEENRVRLKQGRRQFDLAACQSHWFSPGDPFPEHAPKFFISGSSLAAIVSSVEYCVHQDEDHPPMNCVLIDDHRDGRAVAVALNGHQVGVRRFDAGDILSSIPENGLKIHRRFWPDMREWMDGLEIEAAVNNNRLHLRDAARGEHWSVPAEQKEYPDWTQLLAKTGDGSQRVTVHRVPFMDALERLRFFVTDNSQGVRLEMDAQVVNMSVVGEGKGEGADYVPAVRTGDLATITFPLPDLLKILSNFRGDEVSLTFSGPHGPCTISDDNAGDEYLVLIMPMMIEGGPEVYEEGGEGG